MKHYTISWVGIALTLAGCHEAQELESVPEPRQATITSDVCSFEESAGVTRINTKGNAFVDRDLIWLKIICPFTDDSQRGEYTDGNSSDGMFLLKRSGSGWAQVTSNDGFDISASYSISNSPNFSAYYEAQQTPYVYTAATWSEEKLFLAPVNKSNRLIDQYCCVFHADQRKEANYRASDVLWAQTYMQTGAWNIHLSFEHVMACMVITIDDSDVTDYALSSDAVLSIEGMPDIDQQEIVVGNYYAHRSKTNSSYGYRQKASCQRENNGKVLGIASIDEAKEHAVVHPLSGSPADTGFGTGYRSDEIANDGTYICYRIPNEEKFRVIVPPCKLTAKAKLWLRDGSRRFAVELTRTEFEQGKLYHETMKLANSSSNGTGQE